MSFPYRYETKSLNDEARKNAEGSFIQLSQGKTHFETSNDSGNECVVLVPGFSVPYLIFDPTFEYLRELGYRTVRYDLFGRGFSDRPSVRYNIELFTGQLKDLMDALHMETPVHLIGLSMGGPITATFTSQYPDRVKSLTLIDPSGALPISLSPLLKLAKIPVLAEIAFGLLGSDNMMKAAATDFFDPKLVAHFLERYKIQMRYHGFQRALLSTVRNDLLGNFVETYRTVGKLGKPILMFWGRMDATVPLSHSDHLRAAMPDIQFHVIENCGHIPHYEKPDEVNQILKKFLREI